MDARSRLLDALRQARDVEPNGSDSFRLSVRADAARPPVVLVVSARSASARAEALAHDGLAALGEVGGDATGLIAGVGLLAIHIEEVIDSDPDVTRITVGESGLLVERAGSARRVE